MKSPFPGMDPIIEACGLWGDFHNSLITEIKNDLTAQVPEGYVVRAGERSYITMSAAEESGEDERAFQPDVGISTKSRRSRSGKKPTAIPAGSVVLEDPIEMLATAEIEHREAYVEIYAIEPHRRLVTSLELLSPTNKGRGSKGWKQYVRKRQSLLAGQANFIEIDLLRKGRRMPMAQPWLGSPYYFLVSRKSEAPRCKVWPAYSLRPVPAIPVPLASPDADIRLNLQPLIDKTYRISDYESDIDYKDTADAVLTVAEEEHLRRAIKKSPR